MSLTQHVHNCAGGYHAPRKSHHLDDLDRCDRAMPSRPAVSALQRLVVMDGMQSREVCVDPRSASIDRRDIESKTRTLDRESGMLCCLRSGRYKCCASDDWWLLAKSSHAADWSCEIIASEE